MKRTQHRRIPAVILILSLSLTFISCGRMERAEVPLGSGAGRDLFAEAEGRFAEIEQLLAHWSPDRSGWSDGYLMHDRKEGARDAVLYQVRDRGFANFATPVLQRRMTDGDGTEYTVLGMEFELDDELREPHWFAVPEGCQAIYEYDPEGKGLLPFGEPRYDPEWTWVPAIGEREAPELNLTDSESAALSRLLDEYSERNGYFPERIRLQLLLSSSSWPARNMHFYMDGYYLPKRCLTQFKEVSYLSNKGESFTLTTALFEEDGREVQRWFVLPNKSEALYEFLPKKGKFVEVIFNDADRICDFVREKSGLSEEYEFICGGFWGRSRGEEGWYSVQAVDSKTDKRYDFRWYRESKRIIQSDFDTGEDEVIWEGGAARLG